MHYETEEKSDLLPLTKEHYTRLVSAKKDRAELGGENVHSLQGNNIPDTFPEERSIHRDCYKKFTKAISVKKRKASVSASSDGGWIKRTGDLGQKLFPDCCMICRKSTKMQVNGKSKKEKPTKLEYLNAEISIREACRRKNDATMSAAIEGVPSLLAAEFKVHQKC